MGPLIHRITRSLLAPALMVSDKIWGPSGSCCRGGTSSQCLRGPAIFLEGPAGNVVWLPFSWIQSSLLPTWPFAPLLPPSNFVPSSSRSSSTLEGTPSNSLSFQREMGACGKIKQPRTTGQCGQSNHMPMSLFTMYSYYIFTYIFLFIFYIYLYIYFIYFIFILKSLLFLLRDSQNIKLTILKCTVQWC